MLHQMGFECVSSSEFVLLCELMYVTVDSWPSNTESDNVRDHCLDQVSGHK
jgi:hypothetical protein